MKNSSHCYFIALLVFVSSGGLVATVAAQEKADVRDLVQMPVAVNKAAEAGVQQRDVESISRSLREGRVSPQEFNQTMRDVSTVAAEKGPEGVKEMGNHVSQQVKQGVRGRDLANSIHGRLREQGIPAGGHQGKGPPPIARDFIPEQAKERIRERAGSPGSQKDRAPQRGGDAGERSPAGKRDQSPAERTDSPPQRGAGSDDRSVGDRSADRPGAPSRRGTEDRSVGDRSGDRSGDRPGGGSGGGRGAGGGSKGGR